MRRRRRDQLDQIEHIVVLMLENRSFDQVAGWLYHPRNKPPFDKVPRNQPFDGLTGRESNPISPDAPEAWRKVVRIGRGSGDLQPDPNPGEEWAHVRTQMYGGSAAEWESVEPTMDGFVQDYIEMLRRAGVPDGYAQYRRIMDCFTPEQVPVLSQLAYHYAVCDRWFCSVPSQTWTNRSFFHAGTASGLVDNPPYVNWLKNDAVTILNRISEREAHGLSWRVYFDKASIAPLTLLIHFPKLAPYWRSNFAHLEQFYEDARTGSLPSYSFLEPKFLGRNRNDQHPPCSVAEGERLIYDVYQAVRRGKNWDKTLLVITYDEHGGCYDHVPPPRVVKPHPDQGPGQGGFTFERLGPRVCTVLVSPYIEPGTVFRARSVWGKEAPLEHASIIKTITRRWGLRHLTERDRMARDVGGVLTLPEPRTDDPVIPVPAPARDDAGEAVDLGFLRDLSGLAAVRVGETLAMWVNRRNRKK